MDEELVEKTPPYSNQPVTSVGNSWIICRSKSHPGRIYYFNTLTGEAAWNLSDPEIEKAQRTTNLYQSQSGAEIEGCPEPKEPPVDINKGPSAHPLVRSAPDCPPKLQSHVPSRVYNKQIITNQYSKQTISPVISPHCTTCNSVNAIGLGANLPIAHNCNHNVWAFPPNQQIVIASTSTPMTFNQGQNMPYSTLDQQVTVDKTSLPISRRFGQMQKEDSSQSSLFDHGIRKCIPNNFNTFYQERDNSLHYGQLNGQTNDLRQKLTARRKSNTWSRPCEFIENGNKNSQDGEDVFDSSRIIQHKIQIINPAVKAVTDIDADEQWLKENATLLGSHLKLNVSPLKNMLTFDRNTTCWYLVADTNVLLNNINLIKVIVGSDEQCQLMVPDYIMAALQDKSRLSDTIIMSRAHRVLQSLSQQFADGCAVLGRDPSSNVGLQIYNFCSKLYHQGCKVVIISNNVQLERHKSNVEIPILTVQEVKTLLTNVLPKPVNPFGSLADRSIQITVPNDLTNQVSDELSDLDCKNNIPQVNTAPFASLQNMVNNCLISTSMPTDPSIESKSDVGVQTNSMDVYCENSNNSQKLECMSVYSEKSIKTLIITKSNEDELSNNAELNEAPKRREIRLRRNLSHQAGDNNVDKKQFKWRRKKRIESAPHQTIPELQLESSKSPVRKDSEMVTQAEKNPCYDEPIDSSGTSSSFFAFKNVSDKMVVEETSTSGIISNTASNVDSASMLSLKVNEHIYLKNVNEEKDKCKCAMFEVESPSMEEYLKMRCDEWISRFVQIMEEVLTQILQQDPPFFSEKLPPPWTLHEATECIKRKFADDCDVLDAANKLTCLLFKISDSRGKISSETKPAEFMKMYSYGVYLVDSLQTILNNSEDLQSAADALAKLLSDIQDPNHENNQTDSFMDGSNNPAANITEACLSDTAIGVDCDETVGKQLSPQIEQSVEKKNNYQLRSSKKKVPQENKEEPEKAVKFIRTCDIESSFFTSLNLQKNRLNANVSDKATLNAESEKVKLNAESDNLKLNTESERVKLNAVSNKVKLNTESDEKNLNAESNKVNLSAVSDKNKLNATSDKIKQASSSERELNTSTSLSSKCQIETEEVQKKPNAEPKIIRNFSRCLEFEEKLKSRSQYLPDYDTLNYFEDEGDEGEYDYCEEDFDGDYCYADEGSEAINETGAAEENIESEYNLTANNVDKNDNSTFDSIIEKFINEVRNTFLEVHSFCCKSREELSSVETVNTARKHEIREIAQKARSHMDLLCQSLNGILYRENNSSGKKVETLLKEAGIHLDIKKAVEYRSIISKYSTQGSLLLDAVNIIIEAVQ